MAVGSWSDWIFVIAPIALGVGAPMLAGLKKGKNAGIRCGVKPKWQPPPWVFSVVWPVLYLLLGIQGMLLWRRSGRRWQRSPDLTLWAVLTASLLLWWPVFSAWVCMPLVAFFTLVAIAVLCAYFVFTRRALLLLPLAVWLCFASVLAAQAVPK